MILKKFVFSYLLFSLLLGIFAMVVKHFFPQAIADQFWLSFGFISGLTFVAYILAYLGIQRNPETGVVAILGSVVVKMLFAMSFVLIYSLKHQGGNMAFALNFFSLYLLFSLFEILCLLRNLRHQNK